MDAVGAMVVADNKESLLLLCPVVSAVCDLFLGMSCGGHSGLHGTMREGTVWAVGKHAPGQRYFGSNCGSGR